MPGTCVRLGLPAEVTFPLIALRVDLNPPWSGTRSKFRSLDFAVPKNNVPPGRNFLGVGGNPW